MGMGHLFRILNFIECLISKREDFIVFLNDDSTALEILKSKGIKYEIVDLKDKGSDWETSLIERCGIDIWINDRLGTEINHSQNVKKNNILLITFDDNGAGAEMADIHVAALAFSKEAFPKGKKILSGIDYLILNKEIAKYRRLRKNQENIIVTLGGSDTYGVTVKVAGILKELGKKATLHIGPSFRHYSELEALMDSNFQIISRVPSMAETFYNYDLAITGGGITPFEANASGLPCIIIANEVFEIANGHFLEGMGSSVFAGYHESINISLFRKELDIEKMSRIGINTIPLEGAENIYKEIQTI